MINKLNDMADEIVQTSNVIQWLHLTFRNALTPEEAAIEDKAEELEDEYEEDNNEASDDDSDNGDAKDSAYNKKCFDWDDGCDKEKDDNINENQKIRVWDI